MTSPLENSGSLSRRDLVGGAISAAALAAAFGGPISTAPAAEPAQAPSGKQYPFKKSINQWAFPYPQKMTLEQCLRLAKDAGFDGIELNYDLDNDLSPKNGTKHY
jgi:L-ribulose-5-phosphate 3-epimerase